MPSFREFLDAEASRLLGYGFALTGDEHEAWDLTQEALTRVGSRWARMRSDGNPAAYVRTIMVRLNIDRLRRLRREIPWADLPDRAAPEADEAALPGWVLTGMRSLTPRQRTALVLRFVDDLDVAGVAQVMGCSVGTAKSHLSRGMSGLRAVTPEPEDRRRG